MPNIDRGWFAFARDAMRQSPALVFVFISLVGFGWWVERRDKVYVVAFDKRDSALAELVERSIRQTEALNRVLGQVMEVFHIRNPDGWSDSDVPVERTARDR